VTTSVLVVWTSISSKAGCRPNLGSRTDHYRLGTQRNRPRDPPHPGHHWIPGLRPTATCRLHPRTPCRSAQTAWPVATEDGCESGYWSGDADGLGNWAAPAHWKEGLDGIVRPSNPEPSKLREHDLNLTPGKNPFLDISDSYCRGSAIRKIGAWS